MKRFILSIFFSFLLTLTYQLEANFNRMVKNQVKIANGTTEYGSVGYERVLYNGLMGQQSIWGAYIIPWEESHEGSTLKIDGYAAGLRHYFSQEKGMSGFFIGGGYLNQTLKYQGAGQNFLSASISSATVAAGGTLALDFLRLDAEIYSLLNSRVDFKGSTFGTITKDDIAERIGKKLGYEIDSNGNLNIPFGFKISIGVSF